MISQDLAFGIFPQRKTLRFNQSGWQKSAEVATVILLIVACGIWLFILSV